MSKRCSVSSSVCAMTAVPVAISAFKRGSELASVDVGVLAVDKAVADGYDIEAVEANLTLDLPAVVLELERRDQCPVEHPVVLAVEDAVALESEVRPLGEDGGE